MRIKIIHNGGRANDTQIVDAETGQDLSHDLKVSKIIIDASAPRAVAILVCANVEVEVVAEALEQHEQESDFAKRVADRVVKQLNGRFIE